MSTSFLSFIFAGLASSGFLVGSFQNNFSRSPKLYIDQLFDEIEKDIKDFSRKNLITKKELLEIKFASSDKDAKNNNGVYSADNSTKMSDYTLEAWVHIWVQLVSNYVDQLWKKSNKQHPIVSSIDEKNTALGKADEYLNNNDKKVFKEKLLENSKIDFEKIYKKMKKFTLLTDIPSNYSNNGSGDASYEDYIMNIKFSK